MTRDLLLVLLGLGLGVFCAYVAFANIYHRPARPTPHQYIDSAARARMN